MHIFMKFILVFDGHYLENNTRYEENVHLNNGLEHLLI
jgi:hypothetical protein